MVAFSPAYDLVNSSIVIPTKEELALPLNGKKSNFKSVDFTDYFGKQRLGLAPEMIQEVLSQLQIATTKWEDLIQISFLSEAKKKEYAALVKERTKRLFR